MKKKIKTGVHYGISRLYTKPFFYSGFVGMRTNSLHPIKEILIPVLLAGILGAFFAGVEGAIGAMVLISFVLYLCDSVYNHMEP